MSFAPHQRGRRSIRLQGYDYTTAGAYFVTICVQNRVCLLGEIVDGGMRLSPIGEIISQVWQRLPHYFPYSALDTFVVMPNHIHGIVVLLNRRGKAFEGKVEQQRALVFANALPLQHGSVPRSLAAIIQNFKSVSARQVNQIRGRQSEPLWQRNYYEHIVRNESELARIRDYIVQNPLQWELDRENPLVRGMKKPTELWQV